MKKHNDEQYLVGDFEASQIIRIPMTLMYWFINERLFIEPIILEDGRKWHSVELRTWMSNNGPNRAIRSITNRYTDALVTSRAASKALGETKQLLTLQKSRVAYLEDKLSEMTNRAERQRLPKKTTQTKNRPYAYAARSFIPTIPLQR